MNPTAIAPTRPLVNPHASALAQDQQLRKQQAWDRWAKRTLLTLRIDAESREYAASHPDAPVYEV